MLKGKAPLVVAIVLAVVAAFIVQRVISNKEQEARKGWNLTPVIVAAVDIPEGTTISMEMMSRHMIPEQFVTSSVVKPESANFIDGQKILIPLQQNDMLLWSQFETSKAAERLSTIIQKKGRALTIDASGSKAVGGWLRPNDHIDIIGSFKDPNTNEQMAVTLMQNVMILATGKITGTTNINMVPESDRNYSNVSLLLLPEEAEILSLATQLGELTFTLRNPEDIDVQEERGRATMQTLLTGERIKALQKQRTTSIQIIRGAEQKMQFGGRAEE